MKPFFLLFSLIGSLSLSSQAFIDPTLLKADKNTKQDIVVVYKNQANLKEVNTLNSKTAKAKFVYKTLMDLANKEQANLSAILKNKKVEFRNFYIVNMISLNADMKLINDIALLPEVGQILQNGKFELERTVDEKESTRAIEWGLNMIKAPDVWAMGYKGQGIVIGGQDTGYDWDHAALINKYRGWNGTAASHDYNWHDAIHAASATNICGSDSPEPCDDDTHGTHTMGTMVGDDGAGNQIGVAPEAKWIGCRNMDKGDGTLTTYVECFEWFLAPYPIGSNSASGDPSKSPHVINNSWGCPASEGCNTTNFSVMEAALNSLRSSGCVIVVSAGNSGANCSTVNDPPAIFQNSFSVGSTTSTDIISSFSSRGPVTIDGSNRLKPNVSAPGSNVRSCVPGTNTYGAKSGTSMAGPHVVGAVALLLSANPELDGEVDWIEDIIEKSADPKSSTQNCGGVSGTTIPNNTFGWGRINVLNAVRKASVPFIKVDQFGYRTKDQKIAILSNPITGINQNGIYTPSATISLNIAATNTPVFSAAPQIWNGGNTHSQSGDKVWWFDFSTYLVPGNYYISDAVFQSEVFSINDDVYAEVLKTAFKTFYYQRCGVPKASPYAMTGYIDSKCHQQDSLCRSISNPTNTALYRNMKGGWHDAGDYNKYINFTYATLIDLINAYEYNPEAWNDKMDIPESNNGIPDLLDEIKFELDWMVKMQQTDGGINCVVGVQNFASASPPSADVATRFYGPATTSASLTTAAVFAYAAKQFKKLDNATAQAYSNLLRSKAIKAWNWALANPAVSYANTGIIAAGEQEINAYELSARKIAAAIYLFDLTDSITFKTFVEANYTTTHMMTWSFVYPFENPIQQSLLYYAFNPNATLAVSTAIKNTFKNSIDNSSDNLPAFINKTDAYRSFLLDQNHTWGSNGVKTNMGNLFMSYHHFNLDTSKNTTLSNAMDGYLHYMHGVNPLARAYLSNMESQGASHSVRTVYHSWFGDGSLLWDDVRSSTYGPVPGLIPGGANPTWSLDACCSTSSCGSSNKLCIPQYPPLGQPVLKSYKEWNTSWPQNSWSISETSIYVQASYLCLLSSRSNKADTILNPGLITNFSNADVVVSTLNNSIVLTSPNASKYKFTIDNNGKLGTSSYALNNTNDTELVNNSMVLAKPLTGVILKSPNNALWKITAANNGNLITNTVAALPTIRTSQSTGDIIIESPLKGIILTDLNGKCYNVLVNNAGTIFSKVVKCVE